MIKAYLSWSSGKDSAYSLVEARRMAEIEVVGILTTLSEAYDRVAMHGVRHSMLNRQIEALGLPCIKVPLPLNCTMADYEERMDLALAQIKSEGIVHVVYGDLYLEDVRGSRETQLERLGMQGLFPLWQRGTERLAREMIESGIVAHTVCIDPRKLDRSFAGRRFDQSFLDDLPPGIDPCGENGEFHTVVSSGPMFRAPIPIELGEIVDREGFVFADVIDLPGT